MNNHFFAYLSKMRWIYRWGMKRNAIQENIMEHSYEVSVIAHALGIISNRLYGNNIAVSYTHLTLPTNRKMDIVGVDLT